MLSLDTYGSKHDNICKPCVDGHGNLKPFADDQCPVCLEEETDTMLFPCSHQFHSDCILQWVKHNFTCPMCRTEIGQFIPLEGQQLKQEFVELWNQHYLGTKPKPKEDIVDDLKKVAVTEQKTITLEPQLEVTVASPVQPEPFMFDEEITIPIDEFDLVFDDTVFKDDSTEEDREVPEVESHPTIEQEQPPFEFIPQSIFFHQLPRRQTIQNRVSATTQLVNLASLQRPWCTWGMFHSIFQQKTSDDEIDGFLEAKPTHQYQTIDNIRGGVGSGILTTVGKMIMERHSIRNLFPVLRETTPNVAIYFTVYEETKRFLGRDSDNYGDIFAQCFTSGCLGAFCGYLPRSHFTALVPLQFGLHFSTFEVAKQMITDYTGRKRLNVIDVGSTAILGGFVGSCITFPLAKIYANASLMLLGNAQVNLTHNITHQFWNHVLRMSPLWATTACGFEFSRRLITNT